MKKGQIKEIEKFISEEPYVNSAFDFCLGSTLQDAGKVLALLAEDNREGRME